MGSMQYSSTVRRRTAMTLTLSYAAGRPPPLSNQTITRVVRKYFNFDFVQEESIKAFPSYYDRNYYFQGDHVCSQGHEFVLKLNNPVYTSIEEFCGISSLMKQLSSHKFKYATPVPLTSTRGTEVIEMTSEDLMDGEEPSRGKMDAEQLKYGVTVLTFIPGEVLDHVGKRFLTSELLHEVGEMCGRVTKGLTENSSSKYLVLPNTANWHLSNFLTYKQHLHKVTNDSQQRRDKVEKIVDLFEEKVSPNIAGSSFKSGINHGDVSGLNIITAKNDANEYHVAGLIDFGECSKSYCVFDLGICLAYIMTENLQPLMCSSCIEFVGPIIRGFNRILPLNKEEFDSLYYIVLAKCCQSAVMGELAFKAEPWNSYLLTTPHKAWLLIDELLRTPKEEIDEIWGSFTQNY